MKAVISCPRCLRQYGADPSLNGKLGNCSACGATFVVAVPALAPDAGEAFVFDGPLEPHYVFFEEACEAMGRNARTMLRLAGEEATAGNVVRFMASLPYSNDHLADEECAGHYCRSIMRHASDRAAGSPEYEAAWRFLVDRIFRMSPGSRDMLVGAFAGVLAGEYEHPVTSTDTPEFRVIMAGARRAAIRKFRRPWFWRRGK